MAQKSATGKTVSQCKGISYNTNNPYLPQSSTNHSYLPQKVLDYIQGKKDDPIEDDSPKPAPKAASQPPPTINPYQRLQELYSLQSKAAQSLYNDSISQFDVEKSAQKSKIDNASNDAYQQAYLSHMQQKKEMPQLLAAMGISGGGAESTVSSMQNSYGQSRNKIDLQRNQSISDLEAQYAKIKNQAKAQFDKQMYEYDLQYQRSIAGL